MIDPLIRINEAIKGLIISLDSHGVESTSNKLRQASAQLDAIIERNLILSNALEHPDRCIKARFCHGLEDGWFVINYPDGTRNDFNRWSDFHQTIKRGTTVIWVGNTYYMPYDFDRNTKILVKS